MENIEDFKNKVKTIDDCELLLQEPMSRHTSFKVGGPADFFILPYTLQALQELMKLKIEFDILPWLIIGCGSNLLVSDHGFEGVVVKIGDNLSRVTVNGNIISAWAGTPLHRVARAALEHNLTGLEFASGIPGSVGGAVFMNAGAYGDEMKKVVKGCRVFTGTGEERYLSKEELKMGYRYSIFQDRDWAVAEVDLELPSGSYEEIKARMNELNNRRKEKQPLDWPSAGSAFKRPPGYYAGKLIQDAGLKGFAVGGAEVSTKHAGFIINKGNATAQEIYNLIRLVQKRVLKKFGVLLEPEVKIIGKFDQERRYGCPK